MDIPWTGRGDAAATTWIFRGRVAATTWIFRGRAAARSRRDVRTPRRYGAGNEAYADWKKFEGATDSDEYKRFKEERAAPVFDAIAKRAPDARKNAVVEQIASPITHARFLRRHEGNYGPAIAAGGDLKFPEVTTPLPGYYRCGDSTTAGIGVPAVASSGAQCANALLSVFEQWELNSKIVMP